MSNDSGVGNVRGLDVLAIGNLVRIGNVIADAYSTSTLIRTDELNIVVDTSRKDMLPMIRISMKQIGILPEDVDIVVLTHTHGDHCGNNEFFKKAEFYVRKEECPDKKNYVPVSGDIELTDRVRLMHTPGHTEGSMSVLAECERKYAVAGDAIPLYDNFAKMVPPGINYDAKIAMKSIKSIINYADVIVPGHGSPFPNTMEKRK
ncbi:MAG: MBL fold metallo-hydrolase [Methanomassiliicoccaceae archaeon]|nr:MBL fold metallo-hydrolase [Methanomassiliicoccaceae archaeon]